MTRLSHALITRCVQLNDVFFQQFQRAFERIRQFLGREKQNQKSFSSSAPLRSLSHIGCSQYHLLVIIRHNGNHFGDFEQSRTFFLNEFTSSHCVRGEGPPPLSAPDVLSCLILEEKYQVHFEIELIGERFLFFCCRKRKSVACFRDDPSAIVRAKRPLLVQMRLSMHHAPGDEGRSSLPDQYAEFSSKNRRESIFAHALGVKTWSRRNWRRKSASDKPESYRQS